MKFGIDTFGSAHGYSGTGSYLHYFVSHIKEAMASYKMKALRNKTSATAIQTGEAVSFELFGSDMDRYTYTASSPLTVPFRSIKIADTHSAERFWHHIRAGHFVASQGYDAVLYPSFQCLPSSFKTPGVAVINSLITDTGERENAAMWRRLSRAQSIIASSKAVRRNLVQHNIDDSKITVIHNGIDHALFYPQPAQIIENMNIKPFAISRPYFIYTSRISGANKHHKELIHAFELFKRQTHLPHRLVLTGEGGDYSDEVKKEILKCGFASSIFLTGFFPRESLPMLYACADVCVFPSTNEGVGMPILEAMATGIPVICSKSGALPEMAGRAAILFDPDNIEEVASCMEKAATDKSLRSSMIAEGLRWTKRFSWEETVSQTAFVLQSVAAKP